MTTTTTIGLAMIVKDEAPVIARCLASVRPLLAHWIVVDTGSTDDTRDIVRQSLARIPGALHDRPWKNFAANRSEALALARDKADYTLVIDADDVLEIPEGFVVPVLTRGAYALRVEYAGIAYERLQLFRNDLPWRYEGVVHEAPACEAPFDQAVLPGLVYRIVGGGARSRDPDKYRGDAQLLEEALVQDPNNARTAFYLAQSWRDAGELSRALDAYEARAKMSGWEEETFCALLEAAKLHERLERPPELVWSAYLKAHRARPTRAEALTELARHCREHQEHALGFVFARTAAEMPRPADALFVDEATYAWRALDELAIAAFYTKRYDLAAAACARLLTEGKLPATERERVIRNLKFVADARA